MVAGNVADIAFAKQSVKGTAATASIHRIYLAGGGLMPQREVNDLEETSSGRVINDSYLSKVEAGGTPEAYARPGMIAALLYYGFGAIATSGSADPWTHTLTLALTQPWVTFWRMLAGNLFERFVDCKVGQIVLSGAAGQPLRISFEVLGLTPAYKTAAETSVVVEVTDTLMHYDGAGALLVEGVAASTIESFTLTVGAGLASQQGDSQTPYDVTEGRRDITLETVETIQSWSLYNRLMYGSATPADNAVATKSILELGGSPAGIQFKWTRVASPERSLQVALPRLQVREFAGAEPNVNGDPLKQTVTYKGVQPSAGTSAVTAVVRNGKSSAAAA